MSTLQEIKERVDKITNYEWVAGNIKSEDVYWLIEQAEKVAKLEDKNKQLENELMMFKRALVNCDEENKELKRELDLLRPSADLSVIESLKVDKQRLLEEIEYYTKALEFYAEKENYEAWEEHENATSYFNNVDFDGGDKARDCLKRVFGK